MIFFAHNLVEQLLGLPSVFLTKACILDSIKSLSFMYSKYLLFILLICILNNNVADLK